MNDHYSKVYNNFLDDCEMKYSNVIHCMRVYAYINTLKHFWPILGQKNQLSYIFMKKENGFGCLFGQYYF